MIAKNVLDKIYELHQPKIDYRIDEVEIQRCKKALLHVISDPQGEELLLDYGIAYETAGFRAGFRLATQIMAECMHTGCAAEEVGIFSGNPFNA